ncbi:hypothetical protein FE257_002894 [Aspergillus nanangensis]|uniref:DNA recombination and repair protein Rad51-like C-terminal domain-containing protein n=1 Tax=Aspergillus nanangensis TaxID=2582783 RepID=A0AAD4CSJ2_ASPNN|nr:hypothetical protein FE257_002894 [Aspergillus nanangensis]
MASSFGEKLLGEICEQGLDEILQDLKSLSYGNAAEALNAPLGVKELDELLDVFMVPRDQPLREAHQDLQPPGTLDHAATQSAVSPPQVPQFGHSNPVIEISSTASAAGKSHLLYYLAAIAILPSLFNGYPLGGRESALVFIDTDGRFDAGRLHAVTRGIIRKRLEATPADPDADLPPYTEEDIETTLTISLQHVHVFRPQSSTSLLSTLKTLDTYLLNISRHLSATRPLHGIFLDSAGAFFWPDKLHDEFARTEDIGRSAAEIEHDRQQKTSFYLSDMYADLVAELKRLQRRFGCVVVYTTTSTWSARSGPRGGSNAYQPSGPFDLYNPHSSAPKTPSFRSSLPPPWGSFPTLRLVVRRDAVRPFPPIMTPADAQDEAAMRQEVVMRGQFSAWVNGWGREQWPRRVLDGLDWLNGGTFVFHVHGEGVEIGE